MVLCSGLRFFVLRLSHTLLLECITMVRCVTYIHEHCISLIFDLNIKIYLESGKMSLLFDIGIPNFGIWVYHHETILTLVWPWLWPICGWQGFYSQFLSCFTLASKKLGCIVLARPVIPSSTKIFFIFFWELLMTATWCFLQPQLGVLHCPYRFHTCLASASFLPLYSKDLSNWK